MCGRLDAFPSEEGLAVTDSPSPAVTLESQLKERTLHSDSRLGSVGRFLRAPATVLVLLGAGGRTLSLYR